MTFTEPNILSFAGDPLVYTFADIEAFSKHTIEFVITYCQDPINKPTQGVNTIVSLALVADANGEISVDLSDIIRPYAMMPLGLYVQPNVVEAYVDHQKIITGGAEMVLHLYDGAREEIKEDMHRIYILPGSVNFDNKIDNSVYDIFYSNNAERTVLPFLTSRFINKRSIHYYKSELEVSDIFFIKGENTIVARTDTNHEVPVYTFGINYMVGAISGEILKRGNVKYGTVADGVTRVDEFGKYHNVILSVFDEESKADEEYRAIGRYIIVVEDDPEVDNTVLLRFRNSLGVYEGLLLTNDMIDQTEGDEPVTFHTLSTIFSQQTSLLPRKIQPRFTITATNLSPARINLLRELLTSEHVQVKIGEQFYDCSVEIAFDNNLLLRQPQSAEVAITILETTHSAFVLNKMLQPMAIAEGDNDPEYYRGSTTNDHNNNMILDENRQPFIDPTL